MFSFKNITFQDRFKRGLILTFDLVNRLESGEIDSSFISQLPECSDDQGLDRFVEGFLNGDFTTSSNVPQTLNRSVKLMLEYNVLRSPELYCKMSIPSWLGLRDPLNLQLLSRIPCEVTSESDPEKFLQKAVNQLGINLNRLNYMSTSDKNAFLSKLHELLVSRDRISDSTILPGVDIIRLLGSTQVVRLPLIKDEVFSSISPEVELLRLISENQLILNISSVNIIELSSARILNSAKLALDLHASNSFEDFKQKMKSNCILKTESLEETCSLPNDLQINWDA